MSDPGMLQRQWVSLPHGSCDARIGSGALGAISPTLRVTGSERPRCILLAAEGARAQLVESVRRELVDAGFAVMTREVSVARATLGDASVIFGMLSEERLTSDDLLFALGGSALLSLASFCAGSWCGGMRLALMPTDEQALLVSPVTPYWLDCAGRRSVVSVDPSAKHVFFDLDLADTGLGSEHSLMARALMVSTAVAESEKSFSRIWDAASELMSSDQAVLGGLLRETLKSRGHLVSSTALAIRQSASYGLDVMRALRRCVPKAADSTLLAEALRFSARISAGLGKLPLDDVFAQDDLLEALGLPELECDIEPRRLVEALRDVRFERTRRFLVSVPQQLGRVRYMSVDEDLLQEHVAAWCDAHRPPEKSR